MACLKPRSLPHHQVTRSELHIQPTPATRTERMDYFGNLLCFFTVQEPHKELVVEARSEVTVEGECDAAGRNSRSPGKRRPDRCPTITVPQGLRPTSLGLSRRASGSGRSLLSYALQSFTPGRPMPEALLDLTARIHKDFRFDSKVTNVRTPTEEVFRKRRGVCQDFAHLQIACLRSLNLAARYVSGYLRTYPPPGKPRLVGADASHAWVSAYCPGIGWLDMDPTNNLVPSDGHVTLAWGRDYGDVSPLRGLILGGGAHTLKVAVDMEPLDS